MRRASGFHLLLDESLAEEELPLGDVATTPGHGETALGRVPSSERDKLDQKRDELSVIRMRETKTR